MSENRLVRAYNAILHFIHETLRHDTDKKTLSQHLDAAQTRAGEEFTELTPDEIQRVAGYVERDLHDLARTSSTETADAETLAAWFKFDVEQIENFAIEAFLSAADQTRVELARLEQIAQAIPIYHSGEVTAPGVLRCETCDYELVLTTASEIPPCPQCGARNFLRD